MSNIETNFINLDDGLNLKEITTLNHLSKVDFLKYKDKLTLITGYLSTKIKDFDEKIYTSEGKKEIKKVCEIDKSFTAMLQLFLKLKGNYDGKIDGIYGANMESSINSLLDIKLMLKEPKSFTEKDGFNVKAYGFGEKTESGTYNGMGIKIENNNNMLDFALGEDGNYKIGGFGVFNMNDYNLKGGFNIKDGGKKYGIGVNYERNNQHLELGGYYDNGDKYVYGEYLGRYNNDLGQVDLSISGEYGLDKHEGYINSNIKYYPTDDIYAYVEYDSSVDYNPTTQVDAGFKIKFGGNKKPDMSLYFGIERKNGKVSGGVVYEEDIKYKPITSEYILKRKIGL